MMEHDDSKRSVETPDLFQSLDLGGDSPRVADPAKLEQQPQQRAKSRAKKKRAANSPPLGRNTGNAFLTDQDLALRFRVSRQTIWRWVRKKRFPAPLKLSAGTSRWRLDEILAFERKLPRYSPDEASKDAERKRT
jgi:predicted DNA-binding transcriptional regulator AlpA